MRELLVEIEKAHQAKLFYLSLFGTLSLPDIAGALESENGRTSSEKYKQWYSRYVTYTTLSADEASDILTSLGAKRWGEENE